MNQNLLNKFAGQAMIGYIIRYGDDAVRYQKEIAQESFRLAYFMIEESEKCTTEDKEENKNLFQKGNEFCDKIEETVKNFIKKHINK